MIRALAATLLLTAGLLPGQTRWIQIKTTPLPSARQLTPIAFDAGQGETVLFGGFSLFADDSTWTWDGRVWRRLKPAVRPRWRYDAPMFFDLTRGTVVMFGGHMLALWFTLGDTWEWNGSRGTWTKLSPTRSPSPRYGSAACYDSERRRGVLFGGYASVLLGDTWEWSSTQGNWGRRSPAIGPAARAASAMVYDPFRKRAVLFGGWPSFGDTWEWDGRTWSRRAVSKGPGIRWGHAMVYDALRQRVVLFGGSSPRGIGADTWEWDGNAWTERKLAANPPPRTDAAAVWDSKRQRVVLFGGGTRGPIGDHWEYETVAPATFSSYGKGCAGRAGVPVLAAPAPQRPWVGATFTTEVTKIPTNASVVGQLGLSNTRWGARTLPLPLAALGMPGCSLLVRPDVVLPATTTGSSARIALLIPADAALAGLMFYEQAFVADAQANAAGVIGSNGGAARIGVR